MTPPEAAMIMAAGFGTRMGALTRDRPKPLLKVAGKALIDHALDQCAAAGVRRAVVNLHYRGDQIREHLATRRVPNIAFSPEDPILETGGGAAKALPLLGPDPFYTLNADVIWTGPPPLARLAAAWDPGRMDALLLLVARDRAAGHGGAGDFFIDGASPRRRGDAPAAPYVHTGAQIVKPGAFADMPQGTYSMNRVWDALIARGRLAAAIHDGGWVDVGAPEGLAAAKAVLA